LCAYYEESGVKVKGNALVYGEFMESLLRWHCILASHVIVKVAEEIALMEYAFRNMNVMKLNLSLYGRKGYSRHSSSCCKSCTMRKQSECLQIWRRFSPLSCGIKKNPATCCGHLTSHLHAVFKNIDCRCKFDLFIFLYIYIYIYIYIHMVLCPNAYKRKMCSMYICLVYGFRNSCLLLSWTLTQIWDRISDHFVDLMEK
jgi:hypothetical protein